MLRPKDLFHPLDLAARYVVSSPDFVWAGKAIPIGDPVDVSVIPQLRLRELLHLNWLRKAAVGRPVVEAKTERPRPAPARSR